MSRKLILDIYEAFAVQFELAYKKPLVENELHELIESLNKIDEKISSLVSSYEAATQSVSFFEKEKEMRIKFPDIWKMQLQQAKDSKADIKLIIIDLGTELKIDIGTIFKYHENKKLSLEDFSKND